MFFLDLSTPALQKNLFAVKTVEVSEQTDRLNRTGTSGGSHPPDVRGQYLRDFPVYRNRQMTTVLAARPSP